MASKNLRDDRAFVNPYEEYTGQAVLDEHGKIPDEISNTLHNEIKKHLKFIDKHFKEKLYHYKGDHSVYTGSTGIALLKWHLSKTVYSDTRKSRNLFGEAYALVEKGLKEQEIKRLSFLAGDLGPITLGAVLENQKGNTARCKELTNTLLSYADQCCNDKSVPDELLYGRSGYLYSLLFVRKYCGQEYITDQNIEQICSKIIDSGRERSRQEDSRSPLTYYWHHKNYIGAAHGYIGIMFMLLQPDIVKLKTVQDSLPEIKGCIDYLLQLRHPSGNVPSSVGSDTDKHVHWCHGAPGAVHLFIKAHEVFGEDAYLEAAVKCGDILWERGILQRGYGICHGVCGNAYGFLGLYKATRDVQYLYKALKFAEWCFAYGEHGCRVPDRPLSLFEGLSGTVYFFADLLKPDEARFPAFEL